MFMETAERLKRWRLILGAESEDRFSKMQGSDGGGLGLSAEELMMDQALAAIYNQTSRGRTRTVQSADYPVAGRCANLI